MDINKLIDNLNSSSKSVRIENLRKIAKLIKKEKINIEKSDEVNNHIHTKYSFSPYFPAMAAYKALEAGLRSAGIMDHDSVSGCVEFVQACKILNIASTIGFELRVNFNGTLFEGKKINNPDSENIAYIAFHGIPYRRLKEVKEFLKPINRGRNKRNVLMIERLNGILEKYRIEKIDFKKDIYDFSRAGEGGSITERCILYVFSMKLIKKTGKGQALVNFLKENFDLELKDRLKEYLFDKNNPYYLYDLLDALRISFLDKIFIEPDNNECISVFDAVKFGNSINAVAVYAYLGDTTDFSIDNKKVKKFEDDFLDELFPELKRIGFRGVTYMPLKNTLKQLLRIQSLCKKYKLMEISGVDINSARHSFNCPIIIEENFSHLIDSTWALIAHEKLAGYDERYALFNPGNPMYTKTLQERIRLYSEIGRKIECRHPEKINELIKSYF